MITEADYGYNIELNLCELYFMKMRDFWLLENLKLKFAILISSGIKGVSGL